MMFITWPPIIYYAITVIDVLIVAFFIYYLINFFIPGNVLPFALLVGLFLVILFTAQFFKMQLTLWIIQKILLILPFTILILFQLEIRQFLTHKISNRVARLFLNKESTTNVITNQELLKSLHNLSQAKTGAIIILERQSSLEIIKSKAVTLSADITSPLLMSLFNTASPLHDGAVIIKNNKIAVASAFLPITDKDTAIKFGSRHRAAIGISETTDAIALIVSEETGTVSYSQAGVLYYNVGIKGIETLLNKEMKEEK